MAYTFVNSQEVNVSSSDESTGMFHYKLSIYTDKQYFYAYASIFLKQNYQSSLWMEVPSTSPIYCKIESLSTVVNLPFDTYVRLPSTFNGKNLILCDSTGARPSYIYLDIKTGNVGYIAGNTNTYAFCTFQSIYLYLNSSYLNEAPTISGSDTNVGQKTDPFTYSYTVNDINSADNLTITEKANGVTIRTITNAVRVQTYTADLSTVWKQMPVNTSTNLTITVSDGSLSTTRTITFTRKEDRVVAYFKQASLIPQSVQPEQVLVRVIRTIATNADFKVFVCNNGLDTPPTWEDATSAVLSSEAYTFTNRMKTAENYAVNVKIQVLKNTASAYSYIKALGFSYI